MIRIEKLERKGRILDKIIKAFLWVIIGIAIGYAWRTIQIVNAYVYVPPAGWVENARVKGAMLKMGRLYDYKMVGETQLYVDTGTGWRRLRY